MAAAAEHRRMTKYNHLSQAYQFVPVSAYGLKTAVFIKEPGKRITQETGKQRAPDSAFVGSFSKQECDVSDGILFIRTTFGFYPLNYLSLISDFVW